MPVSVARWPVPATCGNPWLPVMGDAGLQSGAPSATGVPGVASLVGRVDAWGLVQAATTLTSTKLTTTQADRRRTNQQ